ncbi:MAG: elongation factor Ts [Rhodospirillales bacterium]|nr:MAG: elongation factor Ts [Rhodospirillales bacterium]
MVEITAGEVKALRERTGAGMMDCKRALQETAGDVEAAVDWLRTKGLAAAAKKAGRIASEGLVAVSVRGPLGAVVEVNTETDFVSRNPDFQTFAATVASLAKDAGGDLEALKAMSYPPSGRTVADEITHMIATIGENMSVRRTALVTVEVGIVGWYVHNSLAPGIGKIAVLVGLESEAPATRLEELGKQLAMHIAAANPTYVSRDDVDSEALGRERAVLSEQARATGKAEAIIEKMVDGRLRRFYEEVCLLDQVFVMDGESRVADVIDRVAKESGNVIRVTAFERYALGEGLERRNEDFASEVAKTAKV